VAFLTVILREVDEEEDKKNRQWIFLQTIISKCKITQWRERSKNKTDVKTFIKEAKVFNGL